MKKEWKKSQYTSVILCESGDILLHNSFMGAVARIGADQGEGIMQFIQDGVKSNQINNPVFKELCDGGFFVPADIDECKTVTDTLYKERVSRLSIMILPHENCNYRCIYCYEKFVRGKMREDIINGLKKFVDDNVGNYSGLSISWFGGEPLLALDVICDLSGAFIRSCNREGVNYLSGMSTNGYLLTPDTVDALFKNKINRFQVCVDGPESIHNKTRKLASGEGTYQRILDNLVNMRNRTEDFSVSIRVNFNNESVPFIEKWLVEEIAPRFANDARFGLHFEPITKRGGPNDSTLDVCKFESTFQISSGYFEKSLALGFSAFPVKKYLIPHGLVCYAAMEPSIIIDSRGNIYKCSLAFDDPRNAVGRLTAEGQLIIDHDKSLLWTSLEGRDTRLCNSCAVFPSCQGRQCPLYTIKYNKPSCPMTPDMHKALVTAVAFGGEP